MKPIPTKLRQQLANDPRMTTCARATDGGCHGRITWEHAYGRKVQEEWMIVPLCVFHHLLSGMDKQKNKWLALQRATEEDFAKYPKSAPIWKQEKAFLSRRYEHPREGEA